MFEQEVIKQLLEKMFNHSNHFSICDLDKLGELTGKNPSQHPNYKWLNALHCVHYADMKAEIKNQLQQKVAECLRPDFSVNVNALAFVITAEGRNFAPIEDEGFNNIRRIK